MEAKAASMPVAAMRAAAADCPTDVVVFDDEDETAEPKNGGWLLIVLLG